MPIQNHHYLEFHPIPEGTDYELYTVEKICDILEAEMRPHLSRAIVFLNNRSKCEEYSEVMARKFEERGRKDFSVAFYHAGMPSEVRARTEEEFRKGEKVVVFATQAFGMGIDIPNIHFAFHWRPPSTLENYLQEIGRAGRNSESRRQAGLEKVRCVLFYSEASFAKARTKLQGNRLHWSDIEAMRSAIASYRDRQANSSNYFIVPADLIKESNALKEKKNPETTQRMLLHWLEKLGKIELGDRVIAHLNLSLGDNPHPLGASDRLRQMVQEKGGTTEKSASILISEIQASLQEYRLDRLFALLFKAHREGAIRCHRYLRIKLAKFGQEQLDKTSHVSDKAHQFLVELAGKWQKSPLTLQLSPIKKQLSLQATQLFPSTAPQQPTLEARRFQKSWLQMVRLLNRLDGIRVSSSFEGVYRVRFKSLVWQEQLMQFGEICRKILPLIAEKHEQQETVNLGDLMKAGATDSPDLLKAALDWLRDFGYITYQQDFLPTSLEVYLKEGFDAPIAEPNMRESERSVKNEFDNYYRLKEWRLNALEALTEIPEKTQRRGFIQEYFACYNAAEIREAILNRLPESNRLGEKLRQEAFTKAMDELNEAQRAIVRACAGNSLIVMAGPGTGKTRTLLRCVAYLIVEQRENPEDILVLAYNTAVVAELRSRLCCLLRDLGYASSYSSLPIYTFHGYVRRTLSDRLPANCRLEKYLETYLEISQINKSLLRPNGREAPHYIFIDEYQDINQERYQMLLRIKDDNTRLIAIGDDDQSIYGYERKDAGEAMSSHLYFKRFEKDFQAQRQYLTVNYRSGEKILSKTEAYIAKNSDRLREKGIQAGRTDKIGEFKIESVSDNPTEQILEAISRILRHCEFLSIAILFRTNAELYRVLGHIRERFNKDGVQIHVQGGQEKFADLREVAVLLDELKRNPEITIGSFKEGFLQYIRQRAWHFYNQSNKIWDDSPYYLLAAAAWDFEKSGAPDTPISQFIEYIKDVCNWNDLLLIYRQYQQEFSLPEPKENKPSMTLSTIHKVKGLEFDAVLIPPADCSVDVSGEESVEEERRLRYVGMTRARDYLHLIVGERETRLYNKQNIFTTYNPHIGLNFDSSDGYVKNHPEGGKGMFTLFRFACDKYASENPPPGKQKWTGKDLQALIYLNISEGDPLELVWVRDLYYHLYHTRLQTNIGTITKRNSQHIRQRFSNEDRLQGIIATSVSRFRVPQPGEKGCEYNTHLCELVMQQGYYYTVNCAGYLQSKSDRG